MKSTIGSPECYISAACEKDLIQHGDNYRGAGYTKSADEPKARYALMLDIIRERDAPVHILDFGCGPAHMLDYIKAQPALANIRYSGLDLSRKYLDTARLRHKDADLIQMNVLDSDSGLPDYDYVILNGLFNYRGKITKDDMLKYWEKLVNVVYRHCKHGMAFNVMSKIVDWKRDDLFHLPFDTMAKIVAGNLSRRFVVRHDYEAYEYTVYVYRQATRF
jgi:SAM-dependent methyltransferase